MKKPSAKQPNEITLSIRVEPRSSQSGVTGPYGDGIKVKLTSPPVDGKANKELIEVLASEFGIPKKKCTDSFWQEFKKKSRKAHRDKQNWKMV